MSYKFIFQRQSAQSKVAAKIQDGGKIQDGDQNFKLVNKRDGAG